MGLHPRRPEEARPQSSAEVRAAGPTAKGAIQGDPIEAPVAPGLAQAGLLAAEALAGHPAGLSVRLRGAGEVLPAASMAVVTPEAPMAVAASGALTEEVMEEAAGRRKE